MKKTTVLLFAALSAGAQAATPTPQTLDELCNQYANSHVYEIHQPIQTYTESLGGYREMALIRFAKNYVFQVEVPGSQYLSSQLPAVERMKDTLRLSYMAGAKVAKICAWTNKTPNAIIAISFAN